MSKLLVAAIAIAAACGPAPRPAPLANQAPAGEPPLTRALRELHADAKAHERALATARTASAADRAALTAAVDALGPDGKFDLDFGPAASRADADGLAHFLDVDGDGRPDLVMIDWTYYGPSSGYQIFVRDGAAYRFAFSDPGALIGFDPIGDHVVLRFEVGILAAGEPRVVRVLDYDRARDRWPDAPSSYVAAQTDLPAIDPIGELQLIAAEPLRVAPAIDDAPLAPDPNSDSGDDYAKTTTLRGNVVADYPAGARGLALGARGEWLFVALEADPPPTATSLQHGMFTRYDEAKDKELSTPPPRTSYCGWIRRASARVP